MGGLAFQCMCAVISLTQRPYSYTLLARPPAPVSGYGLAYKLCTNLPLPAYSTHTQHNDDNTTKTGGYPVRIVPDKRPKKKKNPVSARVVGLGVDNVSGSRPTQQPAGQWLDPRNAHPLYG